MRSRRSGEAFHNGAPSVELWNIAKCHLRLDEPDAAEASFRQFLAQPDLTPEDRADATRELAELRGRNSPTSRSSAPEVEHAPPKPIGLVFSEDFGFFASKLGSYSDNVRPALHLAARYVFRDLGAVSFSGGLRFDLTTDGWHNGGTSAASTGTAAPQCSIGNDFLNDELAAFLVGGLSAPVSHRIRLGGDVGVGLADFEGGPIGGELFIADCNPSYGLRPAFHLGTEASFVLTPYGPFRVRALVEPILFQAHAAYHGTTDEASAAWWRIGSAFGFAFDF